ncbi:hypothetical protein ILUMI_17334 [Ignelater luminosus]|uniref:Reverse transcriptase RNase H-like domain-containing protein n=1 Tax=Ignelater luminosus TaxID=2038154 RepID=A0A8K0G7D5_IGNLU|nr:hypothetical protein ILUMI_17334 [Ignelater luminosus]
MQFGGPKSPLNVGGLATTNVEPASLFSHITPDCKPICTKSRKFNPSDTAFINDEIRHCDGHRPEAPFTVETDASNFAVAATLSKFELQQSSTKKEACAIVEALRKWRHYLEVKNFLSTNGIASSRTTPYNPQGNGQAERYNGIIWKTIQLALKNKNLLINHWEDVLNKSLHCIRSLFCTATIKTLHERMFKFVRKAGNESADPSWLTIPEPILLRNTLDIQNGRESTVSTRDLAPLPSIDEN